MEFSTIAAITVLVLLTLWWVLRPLWVADETTTLRESGTLPQRLEELRHRRDAAYVAIKDLELDLAAGKIAQGDYEPLRTRLTGEAANLLRQIDQLTQASDAQLDHQIDTLLSRLPTGDDPRRGRARAELLALLNGSHALARACPNCQQTVNEEDVFCSHCGTSLHQHCPQCETLVQPDDYFCAQCGTRLVKEVVE